MTIDQVFPIVASFSYSENNSMWVECLSIIKRLDPIFLEWYGDQEALKHLIQRKYDSKSIGLVSEALVSALPEEPTSHNAYFIHYKGAARKSLMENDFKEMINRDLYSRRDSNNE